MQAGVLESVITEITGYSTRKMFDHYNTVDKDDTRKAIERLEAFLVNVYQNVDQTKKMGPLEKEPIKRLGNSTTLRNCRFF